MNRTIRRGTVTSAAVLAALLTVTGCGDRTAPTTGTPRTGTSAPAATASGTHNDADVTFVEGMVPHHGQAVDMAELAATNSTDPKVVDLAGRIAKAQAPEIQTMNGFLTSWGMSPDTSGGVRGMDHSSMDGMTGAMSADQMQQLGQARGAEFDRMFLTMMVEHHKGAVAMARVEIATGRSADARALAREIIDVQQAEIAEMTTLLTTT